MTTAQMEITERPEAPYPLEGTGHWTCPNGHRTQVTLFVDTEEETAATSGWDACSECCTTPTEAQRDVVRLEVANGWLDKGLIDEQWHSMLQDNFIRPWDSSNGATGVSLHDMLESARNSGRMTATEARELQIRLRA